MISTYMSNGFGNVEGWCYPQVATMVELVDTYQRSKQSDGGVAEIGIHHGKLFLLLNSICEPKQNSYAIDLFERQDLNVDQSGSGNRASFERNLQLYDRHQGANVTIIAGDSTTAPLLNLIDRPVRLFSVDGGHTVEHTLNDMAVAAKRIVPEGVVILDDILNHHWLGVFEAAVRFLMPRPTLVPFAIGYNKMLFCNYSHHQPYFDLFARCALATKSGVEFVGHKVVAM
jgi:hypothetical protein